MLQSWLAVCLGFGQSSAEHVGLGNVQYNGPIARNVMTEYNAAKIKTSGVVVRRSNQELAQKKFPYVFVTAGTDD